MANSPTVKLLSECFIKPKFQTYDQNQPYYLAPFDLAMLSAHYIQEGLLFTKPSSTDDDFSMLDFLESLKHSLALTLVHFYPLAGQLATHIDPDHHSSLIYVDCNKGPGVRFIHATVNMTMAEVFNSETEVPQIVEALFDHHKAVNHDGHTLPLLSVQVTEFVDGMFIACSMNHAVADGTSYWHFWRSWSETNTTRMGTVSDPPVHQRWFPEGCGPRVTLPFISTEEFVTRYEAPMLRERIFHFSSWSVSALKVKANAEAGEDETVISALQVVSALLWRSVTRARRLESDQMSSCNLDANLRARINPPMPQGYFGNLLWVAMGAATAGELLEHSLGWAALMLHRAVSELTDKKVLSVFEAWRKSPFVYQIGKFFDPNGVVIGNSPRFDVYGNDFGIGKPVTVRSGYANKFPGKVNVYPGSEGGGSMDVYICLPPDLMSALESDYEFMSLVTKS